MSLLTSILPTATIGKWVMGILAGVAVAAVGATWVQTSRLDSAKTRLAVAVDRLTAANVELAQCQKREVDHAETVKELTNVCGLAGRDLLEYLNRNHGVLPGSDTVPKTSHSNSP